MQTVENGTTRTLTLYAGETLTVSALAGAGIVWRLPDDPGNPTDIPTPRTVDVAAGTSKAIGPFTTKSEHRLDAQGGPLAYEMTHADPVKQIEAGLQTIKSAIETAVAKRTGNAMNLQDKLRTLAAAAKKLPADIEANADALAARIAAVDTRAVNSFGKLHSVLDDAESAVGATEDAVNQLSNGGPTS